MSIRLFRRPAALICSLALLPALSPAALAAGAPAVSDKKSALIRHSAGFKTDSEGPLFSSPVFHISRGKGKL